MNIFLPYENNIKKSVESLDDIRLNKQILETSQLLTSALKELNGEKVSGYYHHPVYLFYKDNIDFLAFYGLQCCIEYEYRFNKRHSLRDFFAYKIIIKDLKFEPPYTPYYMEGPKNDINCIRTTKNVSALFQAKLCKKWEQDTIKNRPPKWTNRSIPEFYKKYLEDK